MPMRRASLRAEQAHAEPDHALRGDGQAGEQRGLVQDLLQVQGHDEHLAAVPQAEQEGQAAAVAQAGAAQQGQPDERLGVAGLGPGEARQGQGGGHDGRDDQRRGPAEGDALGDGEDDQRDGDGDEQRPADVQAVRVTRPGAWPAEDGGSQGGGGQADRDVDQEHGAPAGELDQDAAEDLAGHEADRRHRAVQADGPGPQRSRGEAGGDEGQRSRGDDGRARALDDPGRDQQGGIGGQSPGQAGQREGDQADNEHAAPAEQVGGPAAEDEQAAEGDRVPGDDPAHGVGGHVQLALDRGQGHVDDAEVEHDHERGDEDESQLQAPVRRGRGRPVARPGRSWGGRPEAGRARAAAGGGAAVAGAGVWEGAAADMIPIRYVTDRFVFQEGRTEG